MISIFGGSGFIGNKLAEILKKENINFQILDLSANPKFCNDTEFCNVTDFESILKTLKGDTIINLAAVHRDDIQPKSLYHDVNVVGATNICNAANRNNIKKIIFVSSVAIYGFSEPNADEDTIPKPFNEYGITKLKAEKVFKSWHQEDPEKRTLIIIRPTVVFGEKNRGNVYNLLSQLNRNFFPMMGSGENIKSMAYVDNVASFIKFSITLPQGIHTYNYIDKPDIKLIDLIKISRKTLGKNPNPNITINYFFSLLLGYVFDLVSFIIRKPLILSSIRVKKFCSSSQFDSSISKTNFKAPYKLEDAIIKTINYEFLSNDSDDEVFLSE